MTEQQTSPTTAPPSVAARFSWLDLLRATAVLMVLWAHLVGGYLARTGAAWPPATAIDHVVLDPLAITQHGGFLGVVLFFLVSGYIITHVARRETALEFSLKRLLRIYPPLIFAVVIVVVSTMVLPGQRPVPSPIEIVTNMTLVNYLIVPQVVLIGVAWTLVVEVIFYGLTLATRSLLNSRAIALQPFFLLSATGAMIVTAGSLGDSWFLLAVSFLYIPILVIGSLFTLAEYRLISLAPALILGVTAWTLFLIGTARFYPQFLAPNDSYPVSLAVAVAIFAGVHAFRTRVAAGRFLSLIALTSYSLYLLHGIIGIKIIRAAAPVIGYTAALALALLATGLATAVSYVAVERPSQRGAARLIRSYRRRQANRVGRDT